MGATPWRFKSSPAHRRDRRERRPAGVSLRWACSKSGLRSERWLSATASRRAPRLASASSSARSTSAEPRRGHLQTRPRRIAFRHRISGPWRRSSRVSYPRTSRSLDDVRGLPGLRRGVQARGRGSVRNDKLDAQGSDRGDVNEEWPGRARPLPKDELSRRRSPGARPGFSQSSPAASSRAPAHRSGFTQPKRLQLTPSGGVSTLMANTRSTQ